MKYRIIKKLIAYFIAVLLIFSLILSSILLIIGKESLQNTYKDLVLKRATNTSESLSKNIDLLEFSNLTMGSKRMGMKDGEKHMGRRYLKIVNDILKDKVILIDKEGKNPDTGEVWKDPNVSDDFKDKIIEEIFNGNNLSEIHNIGPKNNMVLAASPVKDTSGNIKYGLIVMDNQERVRFFINYGIKYFFIALVISIIIIAFLSRFLAGRFITPILDLTSMVRQMKEGNYNIRSNNKSLDEIGVLSRDLDELALRLNEAKVNMDNLELMRKDFISSLSHELKTPVTVLKGSIDSLKEGFVVKDSIEDTYDLIGQEVITLERLINDLMELTSLQNPNFSIRKEELVMSDVVNDAIRSMRKRARDKGISIEYNKIEEAFIFNGDYTRLKQLITILLDNALKFSKEGSNIIIKEEKPYSLSIINFGKGIGEKEAKDIFLPFHKDELSKGKGLGLSIAKEISRLHNLTLEAIPSADKAIFKIYF